MPNKRQLSIVIVSFNTERYLQGCLQSIHANRDSVDLEILVVDNASSDGSCKMIGESYPEVRLIVNRTNVGLAKANNQAIKKATGEYLLLLNPDTILLPGGLAAMVAFMDQNPKVGIVGGKILTADGRIQPSFGRYPSLLALFLYYSFWGRLLRRLIPTLEGRNLMNRDRALYSRQHKVEHVQGSCLMMRREMLDSIGLLDEGYYVYVEETDLCYRATQNNWEVCYIPNEVVIHYGGGATKPVKEKMAIEFEKSLCRFHRKYYSRMSLVTLKLLTALRVVKIHT